MTCLRIGTRCSPLALAQTYQVIAALESHHPGIKKNIKIECIKTTGDAIVDRSLTDVGGKSLFTKEIELALLNKRIDLAVHSMKDVTTDVPSGLIFPAMLEREDPRDALITYKNSPPQDFPPGTLFGTSSLRRQVYALQAYPHFSLTVLRGNVGSRLEKIEKGEIGATLLAAAGLKRLGILEKAREILSVDDCLPAVAQGAIGIQCREDNTQTCDLLLPVNHCPTFYAITAERAFMKALQGSCRTPMAGYAYLDGDILIFRGMVSDPSGANKHFISSQGPSSEAFRVGEEAAKTLQRQKCNASL